MSPVLVMGQTDMLLPVVFTAVNVAVLVLRRDPVAHRHFRAPTIVPVIGALVSVALLTTKDAETFAWAGALIVLGLVLWGVNWWTHGRHVEPYATEELEVVSRGRRHQRRFPAVVPVTGPRLATQALTAGSSRPSLPSVISSPRGTTMTGQ
jgi:uncharacterized membrane protein YfcA